MTMTSQKLRRGDGDSGGRGILIPEID
jgi:hypothetical protein